MGIQLKCLLACLLELEENLHLNGIICKMTMMSTAV